ncbi:hypothetical protein [Staphylococcus gallinarum]|uniref:hypothetical protein n=1 Tax=Staphylococcus gallinarum TaxID=1293 RepID=UPI0030BE11F0
MVYIVGIFFLIGWIVYLFKAYSSFLDAVEQGDKYLLFGHTVWFVVCTSAMYFIFNLIKSFIEPSIYYY